MKVKSLLYMLLDYCDFKIKIKHPDSKIYYNIKNVQTVFHNNENIICLEIEREVNQNEHC